MVFLISIILVLLLVIFAGNTIKKHPIPFYICSAVLAAAVCILAIIGVKFGGIFGNYIYPVFSRSGLSASLFMLVMFAGAAPAGSAIMKKLMPIRGQMSIIASILTLGHNISYGLSYFKTLFTEPQAMPVYQLAASICSVIMILIMLPLFITSFIKIRRKINPKKWKKLQRLAYIFYGLMYVHIMLLVIPQVLRLRTAYVITFIVYTAAFLSYLICRLMKASARRHKTEKTLLKKEIIAFFISLAASVAAGIGLYSAVLLQKEVTGKSAVPAETGEASISDDYTESIDDSEEVVYKNTAENSGLNYSDNAFASDIGLYFGLSGMDGALSKPFVPSKTGKKTGMNIYLTEISDNSWENSSGTASDNSEDDNPDAADEQGSGIYIDGTYTGTAFGYEGDISVTISIKNDCLTDIYFSGYYDDPDYEIDGKNMLKRIYEAQTESSIVTDVDVVSGATFTSNGVLEAFLDALDKAMK